MNKKNIKDVISRFSFLIPHSSLGFASILPLLIIALAAISSSTPLLVENLLNGNPPGQKIASNNVQQIAGLPEGEAHKICGETGIAISCSNNKIKNVNTKSGSAKITYTECNSGLTCTASENCAWCKKPGDLNGGGINYCESTYGSGWSCDDNSPCNSGQVCKSANGNCGSSVNWCVKSAYSASCSEINGSNLNKSDSCTSQSHRCTYENGVCKDKTAPPAQQPQSCYSKHGSEYDECKADADCAWFPGNNTNGTGRACIDKVNQGEKCGIGNCNDTFPRCVDNTFCSGTLGTQPAQSCYSKHGSRVDECKADADCAWFPGNDLNGTSKGCFNKADQGEKCGAGNCNDTFPRCVDNTFCSGTLEKQPSEEDNPPPVQKSEPISGTVNIVGSTTASQVTVSVNGSTYSASKDSGIAWKYKTADLPAGSYTVTATATLANNNGTLSGTTTASTGSTAADITISAYSGNLIEEKCGAKGVSENSISGFLHTACMASAPTTLTDAEKGKFDQNKAALAKDKGNPYCGTKAFDVYECKDGSIETIAIGESEDTCNKFPWCPEKGKTGLTTDPCAGPDNRPETCSCQPNSSSAANGKFTQDNCAKDLFCAPGKNPQIPGYACCPKYEQFCPATNTCIGTNESCGTGVKAPDPLPTNQQSLGCPNQNPDGTQNVCSTISSTSSQPTDGIQSGNPGYNSSKNYTRNQNGDKACADNYANTKNANFKYCWKESGSASSGGNGGGGTGGQQPGGGGSAGFIGKACPANPDKTSSSYLASECENKTDIFGEDYYCTKDFKNTTWACCQFGTRFCSLNNLCVSSENDCIAPTPIPNSGNGNTTQPGTAGGPGSSTNHCYNGQKDCTPGYLCSNPAGGSTAQCVVRKPEDPESNCAIVKGFECTDTYDAALNVDNALARDVCRSVGKKYCAKKAQPAQSGCPHALDTSGNKLSDSKSICQTSSTCPAGTKPGSSANNAACGTGQYCCIDTRYSSSTASTQSVASTPESTCKTSKDCVNSKSGNACVYFTSASTGICKTY